MSGPNALCRRLSVFHQALPLLAPKGHAAEQERGCGVLMLRGHGIEKTTHVDIHIAVLHALTKPG